MNTNNTTTTNDNNNQNAGNSLSFSLSSLFSLLFSLSLSEEQEREKASSFFLYARALISFSLFLSFSAGFVKLLFRVTNETLTQLSALLACIKGKTITSKPHREKNTRALQTRNRKAIEKRSARGLSERVVACSFSLFSLSKTRFSRARRSRGERKHHRSRLCSCF